MKNVASVDSQNCRGCGCCIRSCRFGLLSFSAERKVAVAQGCTGCGKCVCACPFDALALVCTESEDSDRV